MHGTAKVEQYTHVRDEKVGRETSAETWNRKLLESQMSPGDYAAARYGGHTAAREYAPGIRTPGYETLMDRPSAPQPKSTLTTSNEWSHQERMDRYVEGKQQEHWTQQAEGESLYQHLQRTGGPEAPVHLSFQVGDEGKPEVVGGHHRIAAMAHMNPDQLIPVVHHASFWAAQSPESNKAYKYSQKHSESHRGQTQITHMARNVT